MVFYGFLITLHFGIGRNGREVSLPYVNPLPPGAPALRSSRWPAEGLNHTHKINISKAGFTEKLTTLTDLTGNHGVDPHDPDILDPGSS